MSESDEKAKSKSPSVNEGESDETSLKEETKEKKAETPETEGEAAGWASWFSNTVFSAKEKSTEMLQYLKQDLTEFGGTVQEAGKDLKDKLNLEDTAKSAVTQVGNTMNVLLEQVSTIFGVGPDDEDEEAICIGKTGSIVMDRVQAKIYSMAMNESIYLQDPENMEEYEAWLAKFDLEEKNDEIVELLSSNPHLQLHYTQLVPEKVSHLVFWHRFYFQVQKIFEAEKEASKSADTPIKSSPKKKGARGEKPLSEEDQNKLLSDYEEEIKKNEGDHENLSRRSSGTHLSSSSSGSFAMVTHDATTDEVKVE